jgi:glycosyltransferase involved in cell wall biosynthesis
MTSAPIRLSLVVPCYNEEAVLAETSRQLRAYMVELIQAGKIREDSQIVFVNDGSSDKTWEILEELCRRDRMFSAVGLSRNFGHQGALLAGLQSAPGDALISIDADLQDDLNAIGQMVDRFAEGYDIVYGVRRERKVDSAFKRLTALGFYRLMGALGARTVYNHADFRLMSRRAVEALRDFREVNLFLRGMVTLIGFPTTTVVYDRGKRFAGETKYPFRKMLALSLSAITSFSNVPLRLITMAALWGIVALIGILAWVIWVRLFTDRGTPGWASILLPMLFIGSLNLLAIGIVGEYMARIFEEVKARPRFLIAETRNLTNPLSGAKPQP